MTMASFSMPPTRRKQAIEDPEYENKIQEAMNGLHSGLFKSIRVAALALGVSPFSNVAKP